MIDVQVRIESARKDRESEVIVPEEDSHTEPSDDLLATCIKLFVSTPKTTRRMLG